MNIWLILRPILRLNFRLAARRIVRVTALLVTARRQFGQAHSGEAAAL
jgi:hypothetical protein